MNGHSKWMKHVPIVTISFDVVINVISIVSLQQATTGAGYIQVTTGEPVEGVEAWMADTPDMVSPR